MEDRLVSVIVPVYKVEFFLRRCVESILKLSLIHISEPTRRS